MAKRGKRQEWLRDVPISQSTHAPAGTFAKDAGSIARIVGSKRVSPKGIGSGIRMLQFFLNRAGRGIPASRRKELEKAKRLLQERLRRQVKR